MNSYTYLCDRCLDFQPWVFTAEKETREHAKRVTYRGLLLTMCKCDTKGKKMTNEDIQLTDLDLSFGPDQEAVEFANSLKGQVEGVLKSTPDWLLCHGDRVFECGPAYYHLRQRILVRLNKVDGARTASPSLLEYTLKRQVPVS